MSQKLSLGEMGIESAKDLGTLKKGPPPFTFQEQFGLQPHPAEPISTYKTPKVDTVTFWQDSGPGKGLHI